jgi:hypothetical protein
MELRPSRNPRWQAKDRLGVYERDGVRPIYWARMGEYAVRYALRRAGYAPTEIRVLDSEQNVIEVVPAEDGRALVQAGKEIRARRRLGIPAICASCRRH